MPSGQPTRHELDTMNHSSLGAIHLPPKLVNGSGLVGQLRFKRELHCNLGVITGLYDVLLMFHPSQIPSQIPTRFLPGTLVFCKVVFDQLANL
jgi:hypothetical protein